MALTPTELFTLGLNIKRRTTNRELLDYLDETMALLQSGRERCPVCAERRKAKAEAMKRYRGKRSQKATDLGDFS